MRFIAFALIFLMKSLGAVAFASSSFSLKLEIRDLSKAEVQALSQFVMETEKLLPQSLRNAIGREVRVRFSDETLELNENLLCPKKEIEKPARLGKLYGNLKKGIELSGAFKRVIIQGKENSPQVSCRHGSIYTIAQATLVHELGHIYDFEKKENLE